MAVAGTSTAANAVKLKVFISYSRVDLDFADQLAAVLDLHGFQPVIDRKGIHGAERWEERLGQLILEADIVVFVLSPDSAVSDVCAWEVEEAHRRGKRIIPVVCRPLESAKPPPRLAELNYIFFYGEKATPGSGFGTGQARLVDALSVDVDWVREHTRLEELAARWRRDGQPDDQLLRGSELGGYKQWRDRRPANAPELTDLQRGFIGASEEAEVARDSVERQRLAEMAAAQAARAKALEAAEAAEKERAVAAKRVVQRTLAGLVASLALAVVASVAGWYAYDWARTAEAEKRAATVALTVADTARKETLLNQSKYLAGLAEQQIEKGDYGSALLLALEALPDPEDDVAKDRPYWPVAEVALDRALRKIREQAVLAGHTGPVTSVTALADGRLATGSDDNTVRVWAEKDGAWATVATLTGHTSAVNSVTVLADGRLASGSGGLFGSDDNTVRVWPTFGHTDKIVARAKALAPRCFAPTQRDRFYLAPNPPGWCGTTQRWPYDAVSLVIAGRALLGKGQDAEAEAEFARAVAKDAGQRVAVTRAWGEAHVSRGEARLEKGEDSEAEAEFAKAVAKDAGQARAADEVKLAAYATRVSRDADAKDFESAKSWLAKMSALVLASPDTQKSEMAGAHDSLGWGYFQAGRHEEALAQANLALQHRPDLASAFDTRGQANLALGRIDEAISDLTRAIEGKYTTISTFYSRGQAHEKKGNSDAAIADYRAAVKIDAQRDNDKELVAKARARLKVLGAVE